MTMARAPFLRRLRHRDEGTAGAEMALVLPMLLALMFGGLEGAHFFWTEHVVIKAVRDGARYAGRQSFASYDCGAGTVASAKETAIQNLTRTGTPDGTGAAKVRGWTSNNTVTVTVSCIEDAGGAITDEDGRVIVVRVGANVAYPSLFATLGFATGGLSLPATSQTVVMGL